MRRVFSAVLAALLVPGSPLLPPVRAQAGGPALTVTRLSGEVRLTFGGVLQAAPDVEGPWTDVTNAASPFVAGTVEARRYFRARSNSGEGIFAARSIVDLTLTGPLQTHFELAHAGTPDGIIPPRRDKPYFDAVLRVGGTNVPVSARVRGNSSLQECPFPKLKFKVSREDRVGTPFAEAREIKIGTHCAEGGQGTVGRLRDETAAAREALAYETMELLGFTTPRVRRARLEYHDTSAAGAGGEVGWTLTRSAVLLEDIEVVADRMAARVMDESELALLTSASFDAQLVTDLLLFHALIGNWDYSLATGDRSVWNTDVLEFADGTRLPVAGDFDLASWVTGVVRSAAPRDYHPEMPDVEREARYRVEDVQRLAKPAHYSAGKERFIQHRTGIETAIAEASIDEGGRTNAVRHVNAFYDALATAQRP